MAFAISAGERRCRGASVWLARHVLLGDDLRRHAARVLERGHVTLRKFFGDDALLLGCYPQPRLAWIGWHRFGLAASDAERGGLLMGSIARSPRSSHGQVPGALTAPCAILRTPTHRSASKLSALCCRRLTLGARVLLGLATCCCV